MQAGLGSRVSFREPCPASGEVIEIAVDANHDSKVALLTRGWNESFANADVDLPRTTLLTQRLQAASWNIIELDRRDSVSKERGEVLTWLLNKLTEAGCDVSDVDVDAVMGDLG